MKYLADYRKLSRFRVFEFIGNAFLILFLLSTACYYYVFYPRPLKAHWEDLPPLPNHERARAFTDVLERNRINVVTDKGNYYSCPYQKAGKCWVPIPREVNDPKSKLPEDVVSPELPPGALQIVSDYGYIPHDKFYVLSAMIRADGQVAFYNTIAYNFSFTHSLHSFSNRCCLGMTVFLVVVMAIDFHLYTKKRESGQIRE